MEIAKSDNTILKFEKLTIGYIQKKQSKLIVNDINCTVNKGDFIALIGRNGAGKSTFLKTLSRNLNPISGAITIDGKNINNFSNAEFSTKISLVLTEQIPDNNLTVFELVALGRQPYTNWIDKLSTEDIKQINWALELTDTKALQNQRFFELSDGQKQLVCIARALAQDTDVIILDEPTSHLDFHYTYLLFSLLKNLTLQTKKTIIISTHQINVALQITDKLMILNNKKLIFGTTKKLINSEELHKLFPPSVIQFDSTTQQFIYQQT